MRSTLGQVAVNGARIVRVKGTRPAAATLNRSATVDYAAVNGEVKALATPNDARFGELYGLHNANDADIDAPEGWDAAGLGSFPADRRGQGRDRRHRHRRGSRGPGRSSSARR